MNPCLILSTVLFLRMLAVGSAQEKTRCFKNPVGVSNPKFILDKQMTSLGQPKPEEVKDSKPELLPWSGRFSGPGWCLNAPGDRLQIDLGRTTEICGVGARPQGNRGWIVPFKVSYFDGSKWNFFKDENDEEKIVLEEKHPYKEYEFPKPVRTRYIRFHPIENRNNNCLRVEVYKEPSADCSESSYSGYIPPNFKEDITVPAMKWFETPSVVQYGAECAGEEALGLEIGAILNQQITASSQYSENHGPENARLNRVADPGRKVGAWSAANNNKDQWLRVDFGRIVKITKVATQGRQDYSQWVKTYTLSFSEEKEKPFTTYKENDIDKEFTGNTDQNSIVTHNLLQPITAQFVEIHPMDYHNHMSMRAEFYGCVLSERYQVLGRVVHMDIVKEHLKDKKGVNFEETQEQSNNIELEVLADTVYVKGDIKMHGIKKLTIVSRSVISATGSKMDVSGPTLKQTSKRLGDDGENGKHGSPGAQVEIFADTFEGNLNLIASGGKGKKGQNGRNGEPGQPWGYTELAKGSSDCAKNAIYDKSGITGCQNVGGQAAKKGRRGKDGGYAGKSGDGGNAGSLMIKLTNALRGKISFKACPGSGAPGAKNGEGGHGGAPTTPGEGAVCVGRGVKRCSPGKLMGCQVGMRYDSCVKSDETSEALRGKKAARGDNGIDGQTSEAPGYDGQGSTEKFFSHLQVFTLEVQKKYPLVLLKLMKRHAEDAIWANQIKLGEKILKFICSITQDRDDASAIRKAAQRRLGFLNKDGFDRFGNNKLFAPLQKCSAFKEDIETAKRLAEKFQSTYNDIKQSMDNKEDLKKIFQKLPEGACLQVSQEKDRLVEARQVSIDQKCFYVKGITRLEGQMEDYLNKIPPLLDTTQKKGSMTKTDIFAVLKGASGFVQGAMQKDPFKILDTALQLGEHFETQCTIPTFKDLKIKIQKWLKFSEAYVALKDSNDLNFKTMDVGSIPEIMKADLERNREGLTADLVCLLQERALPRHKARLEEVIANFFSASSERINLIAKIIDLDNDIGTFNYDIDNLQDTEDALNNLGKSPDAPIAANIQQNFLDDLLQTYKQAVIGFTKKLYNYYKSFEFQSLWDVKDEITEYQSAASTATDTDGKLQGMTELSKAIYRIEKLESHAKSCYTSFRVETDIHKWTFNYKTDPVMFEELYKKGRTSFHLAMGEGSNSMYNMRLLKMYVELDDDDVDDARIKPEFEKIPAIVYLRLRHLSTSYFKKGDGKIRTFRQELPETPRIFQFNRFGTTNTAKCEDLLRKTGERSDRYCIDKKDSRFEAMCCHALGGLSCGKETQVGEEECKSLFGTYELSIPINKELECQKNGGEVTDENCKDFKVHEMFTKMNVWAVYFYWSGGYPKGPDDGRCTKADEPSKSKAPWPGRVQSLKKKPTQF